MAADKWGLHWFRRDLRFCGNPALDHQVERFGGRVLGFFCFDREFLSRPDFSADRFGFFLETLVELRNDLRALGGDLLVLSRPPREAFPELLAALHERSIQRPSLVTWNRDYEPFARRRDAEMTDWFAQQGVETHTCRDHLFAEPEDIAPPSADKSHYSVYSPFARRWFELLSSTEGQSRLHETTARLGRMSRKQGSLFQVTWESLFGGSPPIQDSLDSTRQDVSCRVRVPLPPAGRNAALQKLSQFQDKIELYKENRDFPILDATSGLSGYLKNGSITSAEVLALSGLGSESWKSKSGPTHFVKEIAWREFYYHILWHRPDVEYQSFLEHTRDIEWENSSEKFEAWKTGQTGFPIVDAGMRELAATGRMHNRLRMIVASFLTKDLLIDWKWGERHFMEKLLDGDLAPNNGGWQWAASTGCDPQPYFRIFNPFLQSQKFDTSGTYIARWVPELAHLEGQTAIHEPKGIERGRYPSAIVDHGEQRIKALALFKRTD